MESRALYRTLARLLRKHLGGVAKSRPWLQHAADEFRSSAALSGADVDSRLQLLRDYVFLIENTHAHWDLLLSYNIGIDREKRQQDTMRRSAASVGLQLPEAPRDAELRRYGDQSGSSTARAQQARQAFDDSSGVGSTSRQG